MPGPYSRFLKRGNSYYGMYRTAKNVIGGAYAAGRYLNRKLYGNKNTNTNTKRQNRRQTGRQTGRQKYKPFTKRQTGLKQKVNRIQKQLATSEGTYVKKTRYHDQILVANVNEVNYGTLSFNSTVSLESAIDSVKYFDPAAPGTLVTVNLAAATYQQSVRFVNTYGRISIRNNFGVPCNATMYILKCKTDTSITPTTAMSNSLADESASTIVNPQIYPSDCHEFNDLWRIVRSKSVYLEAGKESSISMSLPAFNYDVSRSDTQTSAYQKYFHGSAFLVRLEGVMAHGATAGYGISKAGLDVAYDTHYVIKYPAGVNVNYIETSHTTSAFTGTVQVSELDVEQGTYTL